MFTLLTVNLNPFVEQIVRGPHVLLGHSNGSCAAMVYAARRPDMVRAARASEATGRAQHGRRFRHTVKFVRWRPDREPQSCTYEQLDLPTDYPLSRVLGAPLTRGGEG